MYHIDDQGTTIRLWYFLEMLPPTPDQFRSLAARGKPVFRDDPVATRWATGVSTWGTEALARAKAASPRVNRGRWHYMAGLDIATDGKDLQIERTTQSVGHFTVFGDSETLCKSVAETKPL